MTDINSQLVDRKGRQWQERTVIIKQEENGFGFTLTKEMPVFVDKVFDGSSAQKAGIQPNDRIMKVNGIGVMAHKHQEVVDMIKDSSHVTITVLGSKSNQLCGHNAQQANLEISSPRQLQELTLQSLKMMLHKQKKNYESLSVDYSKQRTEKLEKELRNCESIIGILEGEIASKSPAIESLMQATTASIQAVIPGKLLRPPGDERLMRLLGMDKDGSSLMSKSPTSPNKILRTTSDDSNPRPCRSHTFSNGSISPGKVWRSPFSRKIEVSEDDGSDDDLSDEVDGASESGPFSSLQELKGNPGHMSVFLHYLFMSNDPKCLLFYLVANSYQIHCKSMEIMRQRGLDIYWTFFLDNSPLWLDNVDEAIKLRILSTLESEENESKVRSVFVEARESLSVGIIAELANYRHKRVLGLASIFGDQYVTNQMSITKQLDVVINLLTADLKTCLDEKSALNINDCLRNQAIAACLVTFLVDVITVGNRLNSKFSSLVDKVQPFTRADILIRKGKSKKKVPNLSRNGHNFQLMSYKVQTNCDMCGQPLWGVIYHGYHCAVCETNSHKFCCTADMPDCNLQRAKSRIRKPSNQKKITSTGSLMAFSSEAESSKESNYANVEEEEKMCSVADMTWQRSNVLEVEDFASNQKKQRYRMNSDARFSVTSLPRVSLPSTILGGDGEVSGEKDRTEHKRKVDLGRTHSEKLTDKPDTIPKPRSAGNTLSWGGGELLTAEEAQFLKPGTLDLFPDGKQHLIDEDMKELLGDTIEEEPIPWALVAHREVVQSMRRHEVVRQENIRELVYTERTHLHKLKIMKYMYKIMLQRQNILTAHQVEQLFPSLEELILFHSGLCADLKVRVGCSNQETLVVKSIADVLLRRFDGAAGERLCHACSVFASNQAKAEKLCKEWKRKNERLRIFLKNTEGHPLCQRLTLTELMPIAWTRLTRYKLLIENIFHAYKKDWDNLDDEERAEATQVEIAIGCVKGILKYVNKQVKRATNRQKLVDYQTKMDVSGMEKAHHPILQLFKNLDLTTEGRVLLHEGPLTWRIQHRKVVELRALLLTDVLVLLEKNEDKDKFYLRTHTVETVGGVKEELSTVIRLKDCLLRTAAADRGGRTFLLVNNSSLMKLAQMYEFTAETPREKKRWEEAIQRAMMGTWADTSPEIPSSPIDDEYGGHMPINLSSLPSNLNTRDQLNKIDDDIKKLMNRKLEILRAIQGGVSHRSSESTPAHTPMPTNDTPVAIVQASLEQAGEIISTVSHIMVPNPTKSIVAETQLRLTDIIDELQRNLSKLMGLMKTDGYILNSSVSRIATLDLTEDSSSDNLAGESDVQLDILVSADHMPSTDEEGGSLYVNEGAKEEWSNGTEKCMFANREVETCLQPHQLSHSSDIRGEDEIVAPPEVFAGENCATPTPGDVTPNSRAGTDSGTSTPRYLDSPSLDVSPLTSHLLKAERLGEFAYSEKQQTKIQSSSISHALHMTHMTTAPDTPTSSCSDYTSTSESDCNEQSSVPSDNTKLSIDLQDYPVASTTSGDLSTMSSSPQSLKSSGCSISYLTSPSTTTCTDSFKDSLLSEENDSIDFSPIIMVNECSSHSDYFTTTSEENPNL